MTDKNDRLIWIDMEMTGLDVAHNTVLEIATIVTNGELQQVAEGPTLVIGHSLVSLEAMDEWNTSHHRASGLWQAALESDVSIAAAESATLDFLSQHCMAGASPLCGNSIGQDKLFLMKYMPRLAAFLHYRVVDVSSFKEMLRRWFPEQFAALAIEKKGSHRALDDIRESIAELATYRSQFIRLDVGKQTPVMPQ